MATLADAFLADFEEETKADASSSSSSSSSSFSSSSSSFSSSSSSSSFGGVKLEDPIAPHDVQVKTLNFDDEDSLDNTPTSDVNSATAIATLLNNTKLQSHLAAIENLQKKSADAEAKEDALDQHIKEALINVTREEEYDLIVQSNELIAKLDDEILLVHKFVRDIYSIKLKELETMVQTPVEYARLVQRIANQTDLSHVDLNGLLPQHAILAITVTSSASQGKPLPPGELKKVLDGCEAVISLDDSKRKILSYVASRMEMIAPNLSAILGSDVASQLIGAAGGLVTLSKIPSCNVQVIGVKRKALHGFASTSTMNHFGVISNCSLIMNCPNDLKRKALRLVAGKVTLAARSDAHHEDPSGALGRQYREFIEKKIDKWQEPPPAKLIKALPAPDDKPRKKRGGARRRKQREMMMQSDIDKKKNRMVFGKAEETDDYTGEGFGMLGESGIGGGSLRNQHKSKVKKPPAQKNNSREKIKRLKLTSSGSGLASTIAFTPVQGMELIHPDARKHKEAESNNRYFSQTAGFTQIGAADRKLLPPVPVFKG